MAVAFGTIGAFSEATVSPLAVAYPGSISAGDMFVMGRNVWQNVTGVPDAVSGWTNQGYRRGGVNTANDDHTTAANIDTKEAVGGETGTLSTTASGTISALCGQMARYTKGAGTTWDVAGNCTGDDATHAANRLTGAATGTLDLAVGDMVVAFVATDTDAALTITSPTFTFSGITFGTVNRRTSGAGTINGTDGNCEIFDALVTAGTATVGGTFAMTTATLQCGPVAFVRLREVAAATLPPIIVMPPRR